MTVDHVILAQKESGGCLDYLQLSVDTRFQKWCGIVSPGDYQHEAHDNDYALTLDFMTFHKQGIGFKIYMYVKPKSSGGSPNPPPSTIPPPQPPLPSVPEAPLSAICGIKPKLVKDDEVTEIGFPWQVGLYGKDDNFLCGGTLISNRTVLTAAQCIDKSISMAVINDYNPPNIAGHIRHAFACQIVHPAYNRKTKNYDFGLLILAEPVISKMARPACLPKIVKEYDGRKLGVSGYGTVHTRGQYYFLPKDVYVTGWSRRRCRDIYGNGSITDQMMCAASPSSDDICHGDIGGPLTSTDGNGVTSVEGVASWGTGCYISNFPEVFGQVDTVLGWINDNGMTDGKSPFCPSEDLFFPL